MCQLRLWARADKHRAKCTVPQRAVADTLYFSTTRSDEYRVLFEATRGWNTDQEKVLVSEPCGVKERGTNSVAACTSTTAVVLVPQ